MKNANLNVKLGFLILAVLLSSILKVGAQPIKKTDKVDAVEGIINLTPVEVILPSTGEYIYLAKVGNGYAFFVTKNADLYQKFAKKGKDSCVILEGAVFSPLQHYTRKQWKLLSREIKIFFPQIAQKELEDMKMYLIFGQEIQLKKTEASTEVSASNSNNSYRSNNTPSSTPQTPQRQSPPR